MVGRSHPESLLSPVSPVPSVSSLSERSGQKPTNRKYRVRKGHNHIRKTRKTTQR